MCLICLVVAAGTLAFQIHVDHTLIFTGQYLWEDADSLVASIGIFGLGFGRRHHRSQKTVSSWRYYDIEHVRDISVRPFGIRVKADVYTATSSALDVDETMFETPGTMKQLLATKGKKKRVTFRIEHNLLETEEARLLDKLNGLRETR
jgi:hypothetical protein